ncbi:aldo/keto reductase [Nocardiopsis sediminis]|uniref:Aldo/keto reductase n=1 Tax=Nocardiopsis sediminis TaxID=1778267 RepID=A0ABV8FS03_9ACTN
MDRRQLGRTGIEVSPIGLGCMQLSGGGLTAGFYPHIDQPTATSIVGAALDGGVDWFDTAELYGSGGSERALTTALAQRGIEPGGVTIATKWLPLLRTAASITHTVGARLEALQGFPIDLHQIHMPFGNLSSIPAQVRRMADLKESGRIRAVGVSNFSARQMTAAHNLLRSRGIELASNQVQVSLLKRDIERDGTLEAARRLGITLIAYSPLHSGLLTGKFHADPGLVAAVPRTRRAIGGFSPKALARTAPLIDELRAIGDAHGATPAQVALNWLVGFYGDTVIVIPGASRPHQAAESAGAMDLTLTARERDRLDELSRACTSR